MMKILVFIFFSVFAIKSVYPNENWPSGIEDSLISAYISTKKDLTMDELEKEYNYILDFLEKAIESCEYNIVNHINKSLTRKTLVLENGELSILEKESVRCIWSREDQSFYYESDVNVSLELINRICYIRIREGLIEYWKEITGETLREHFYDNKTNLNQSLQLLEKLQENK